MSTSPKPPTARKSPRRQLPITLWVASLISARRAGDHRTEHEARQELRRRGIELRFLASGEEGAPHGR